MPLFCLAEQQYLLRATKKETALEINGHGVFSNLLISALNGGASDIFGRITPGCVYSYIDSSLNDYDQRPLFKSYVSSFITLRETKAKISYKDIRKLAKIFKTIDYKVQLNPSFEPTNFLESKKIGSDDLKEPFFKEENGKTFELLQICALNGLIIPTKEKHMFYAAMRFDTCELTPLGKYYWQLAKNKII